MPDHIHMLLSVPPKHAISQVAGYIKGKSAIHLARTFAGRKRSYVGQNFRARGYCVSTVDGDEATIREYIRNQEKDDRRLDRLDMLNGAWPPSGGSQPK
jgi:putative transposase